MNELLAILLAALMAITGIPRTIDSELQAIAQRRVVEVQSNWSHDGADPRYYEILTYNDPGRAGYDPAVRAAEQWHESTTGHSEIIHNPSLTRIGCAVAIDETDLHWWVCILAPAPAVTPQPASVEAPAEPSTEPVMLPDTSMTP